MTAQKPDQRGPRRKRNRGFEIEQRIHRALTRPSVQKRLLKWLPGRLLARREAERLFDMVNGFVFSQVLSACVELKILEIVCEEPRTLEDLSKLTGIAAERLEQLIQAAAAMNLVMLAGEEIALGTVGAGLLGNPSVVSMVHHHNVLYRDLLDPVALLARTGPDTRSTELARYWAYAGAETADRSDAAKSYSELMATSQDFIAEQALDAFDFSRSQHLLDVGGGLGVFAGAVKARHPELRCGVFDLPEVTTRAAEARPELEFHPGSFLEDPLPAGPDLISLVRVMHDHDDPAVLTLLERVRVSLAPRGRLLIIEPLRGKAAGVDAYFACYFLAMGQGRLRSLEEIEALLISSGFRPPERRRVALPMLTQVLVSAPA